MFTRRKAFMAAPALGLMAAGCSGSGSSVTVAQVKAYADAITAALTAAAGAYLAGPPAPSAANAATVSKALADLKTAQAALALVPDTIASGTTIQIVQQILTTAQALAPILMPLLGAAGIYLPLGLAVLQAFVDSLPPPPATPAMPPAAMTANVRR